MRAYGCPRLKVQESMRAYRCPGLKVQEQTERRSRTTCRTEPQSGVSHQTYIPINIPPVLKRVESYRGVVRDEGRVKYKDEITFVYSQLPEPNITTGNTYSNKVVVVIN